MLAFFRGTGPIGLAIRWQTRGIYSHVGWICKDGTIIEAWQMGGVLHSSHPFVLHGTDTKIDVFAVRGLTSEESARIELFLRNQLGAGYDFLGILRFLSRVNRNNYDRWFCSELVAEACEESGRPLLKTEAFRISPGTLSWSTELDLVGLGLGVDWWEERFSRRIVSAVRHFENWGAEVYPS